MRSVEINTYFRWWRRGHNFFDSCEIRANSWDKSVQPNAKKIMLA